MTQFKIYKSSAGSGKTYTLVKEYLRLVLMNPDGYRNILALTFTNKATEEMKTRIVQGLIDLSKSAPTSAGLLSTLVDETSLSSEVIIKNAQRALDNILHDYSNFSVSTIDSFFSRIIRSLAREINLPLRLDIKLDMDEVIMEITDQLLLDISTDKELAAWLTEFSLEKLREDKGWNIEGEIWSIAYELFKEQSIDGKTHSRKEVRKFSSALKEIRFRFESQMKAFGEEGLRTIAQNGLVIDDFMRKTSGPAGYFLKIVKKNPDYGFNTYQMAGLESPDGWSSKSSPLKNQLVDLAQTSLHPLLVKAYDYWEKESPRYIGAVELLKRIFFLGIVEDLKKKLANYRDENNLLLISDTPKLLSTVISEDEAPFLYEKSGTRFHHFLIDEFQDTSDLQWKNLMPLVVNSLATGNFSMIVGDVKQSIYRWRSGNMHLLDSGVMQHLAPFKSVSKEEKLDVNFRSKREIVDFNNSFFSLLPAVINKSLALDDDHILHRTFSDDVMMQRISEKNGVGGRIEFYSITDGDSEEGKASWKEEARKKLLDKIKELTSRGYTYRNIAILVRDNKDGDDIATFLISNNITQVISPDSLLLSRSPEIRFLISVFRFLNDNKNHIAAGEVLFYYLIHIESNEETSLHGIFSQKGKSKTRMFTGSQQGSLFDAGEFSIAPANEDLFFSLLPKEFTQRLQSLSRLPVYELCEQLISIFNLHVNDAYILRFLDLVLEYTGKEDTSLQSFLKWWDESSTPAKASVITSENVDAIRITTIHKAKGLQFPVVIIPFADWSISPKSSGVLWLQSDEEPFKQFGKLPLAAVKNLKNSVFREGYEEEVVHTAIDNVNLMYVAFTRAEEELVVFFHETSSEEMNNTGNLIKGVIDENEEWKAKFPENESLIIGETSNFKPKTANDKALTISLEDFPKLKWQDKIRLSLKSEELLELLDQPLSKAINYGVLVHRVLSSIGKLSEISKAVDEIFFEGLINAEEKEQLESEITSLLNDIEIKKYFSNEWEVMAEREIIMTDGEILRPDRVLIKGNSAIVIDFKTGKERPAHHAQINKYGDALSAMKFSNIEKHLVYIADKRVVKIS